MITIKHYPSDWDTMPDVSWSVRDDAAIAANHPCYYTGYDIPNYPMPAIQTGTNSLIAWLWVNVKRTKRNNKKLLQWYCALCFDKHGHYTG